MMIQYESDKPTPEEIERLYRDAGWFNGHYAELQTTIANTSHWVVARRNGLLIGMGRIMTDGFLYACLYDVIVDSNHRNQGIGKELLTRMIRHCDEIGVQKIHLWPAKGLIPYYKDLGFEPLSEEQPTMVRKTPKG